MAAATFGFDLDMTLVDSEAAIVDGLAHVADHYGVTADRVALAATVGLPLEVVFPDLVPGVAYADALQVYRARYLRCGVPMSRELPGARDSLRLLRRHGQRILVISAKHAGHVDAVLAAVGLRTLVDAIEGERFGPTKGDALLAHGAWAYVGDHPGDMVGARAARATAIAVVTGPTPAADLRDAGADVVLADLTALPQWLQESGRLGPAAA